MYKGILPEILITHTMKAMKEAGHPNIFDLKELSAFYGLGKRFLIAENIPQESSLSALEEYVGNLWRLCPGGFLDLKNPAIKYMIKAAKVMAP